MNPNESGNVLIALASPLSPTNERRAAFLTLRRVFGSSVNFAPANVSRRIPLNFPRWSSDRCSIFRGSHSCREARSCRTLEQVRIHTDFWIQSSSLEEFFIKSRIFRQIRCFPETVLRKYILFQLPSWETFDNKSDSRNEKNNNNPKMWNTSVQLCAYVRLWSAYKDRGFKETRDRIESRRRADRE